MKDNDELKSKKAELRKLPEVEDKTLLPQELQEISDKVYPPWESLAPEKRAELVRAYCEDMAQNAAKKIQEKTYEDDVELSFCIRDLGEYGKPEQYRKLVESFLDYKGDDYVVTRALSVLCDDWNLAKEYLDVIKKFIIGVDCEGIDDLRSSAFFKAGYFLRDNQSKELLELLLDVFENFGSSPQFLDKYNQEAWTKAGAYAAIGAAMGEETYGSIEANSLSIEIEGIRSLNQDRINKARERLLNNRL